MFNINKIKLPTCFTRLHVAGHGFDRARFVWARLGSKATGGAAVGPSAEFVWQCRRQTFRSYGQSEWSNMYYHTMPYCIKICKTSFHFYELHCQYHCRMFHTTILKVFIGFHIFREAYTFIVFYI